MIQSDSEGEGLLVEATTDTKHVSSLGGRVTAICEPGAGTLLSGLSVVISH
jgi:hypothetical protein